MYQCINVSMYLCLYVVYLSIYRSVWFCQQETATQDARHKRIASAILVVRGSKLYTSKHTPMGQSDGDCHWSWVIFWSPSFSWPQDHNGIYSSKTTRVWNSRSLQKLNRKPGPGQFLLVLEVMKPAMNICNVSLPCLIATVFPRQPQPLGAFTCGSHGISTVKTKVAILWHHTPGSVESVGSCLAESMRNISEKLKATILTAMLSD